MQQFIVGIETLTEKNKSKGSSFILTMDSIFSMNLSRFTKQGWALYLRKYFLNRESSVYYYISENSALKKEANLDIELNFFFKKAVLSTYCWLHLLKFQEWYLNYQWKINAITWSKSHLIVSFVGIILMQYSSKISRKIRGIEVNRRTEKKKNLLTLQLNLFLNGFLFPSNAFHSHPK